MLQPLSSGGQIRHRPQEVPRLERLHLEDGMILRSSCAHPGRSLTLSGDSAYKSEKSYLNVNGIPAAIALCPLAECKTRNTLIAELLLNRQLFLAVARYAVSAGFLSKTSFF